SSRRDRAACPACRRPEPGPGVAEGPGRQFDLLRRELIGDVCEGAGGAHGCECFLTVAVVLFVCGAARSRVGPRGERLRAVARGLRRRTLRRRSTVTSTAARRH